MKDRFHPFVFRFFFILVLTVVCGAASGAQAASDARQGNWIQIAPGARPAYVGIQGGTATVSLSFSPDGSIIAHTGTSGNDFTKILHSDPPAAATTPDTHSSASAEASPRTYTQASNETPLLPVGLDSRPEEVMVFDGPAPHEPKMAARFFKPLKLGSYKQVLRRPG